MPRPLTSVDKDKYNIGMYMEHGQLNEQRRVEAYEKYYKVKFQRMCEKKAITIYEDYRSRVKKDYEQKKSQAYVDKS